MAAGWRFALIAALLGAAAHAHARQLHAAAAGEEAAPCAQIWSAALDTGLANTLASGPDGAGRVTITLNDDGTLDYDVSPKGTLQLALLGLRVKSMLGDTSYVPLLDSAADSLSGSVDLDCPELATAVSMLVEGAAATAEAVTVDGAHLVGAFSSACPPQEPEPAAAAAWQSRPDAGLPACDLPGFPVLYTIPADCPDINSRVSRACGVQLEDILLASAFTADGREVEGPRRALCLPDACPDPCGPDATPQLEEPQQLPAERQEAAELDAYGIAEAALCDQPGFESYYAVTPACERISQRLSEECGLDIETVLEMSRAALWRAGGGLCLPAGCDPCGTQADADAAALQAALESAAPNCANSYHFTQAFEIPRACDRFAEALQSECGLEPEAVAAASAMASYPEFAGFGPGKTVCLPEYCRPSCQQQQQAGTAASR